MAAPDFPLWPFPPNWSANVTETLSWLTDVLTSKTGSEQRRSLLEFPRREIEYIGLHDGRERSLLDNLLTGEGSHDWMIPLWWDIHYLDVNAYKGDNAIAVSTAMQGEFLADGWLVLMASPFESEMVQVDSVSADGIVLKDALTRDWSNDARIFPLKRSRFTDQPQLSRKSDRTVTGSYRFIITERNLPTWPGGVGTNPYGLIRNGLLARKFLPTSDGSGYDVNAGITVGQSSMILSCFLAYKNMRDAADNTNREAADIYLNIALDLLDGVVGDGSPTGAILRQPVPVKASKITLPHWLYVARDDIEMVAEAGQGYEMFPVLSSVAGSFASAAPETFRDFDRAFAFAVEYDKRDEAKKAQWSLLREAFRLTNLQGRQVDDGRLVLRPLPGRPVLPKGNAEPTGMFAISTIVTDGLPGLIGISDTNSGARYVARDLNGDVLIEIPAGEDYTETANLDKDGMPDGTTTVTGTSVRRLTRFGRRFRESWRASTSYRKADQFVFVEVGTDRVLDAALNEGLQIELTCGPDTFAAPIDPASISTGDVRQVLIPRGSFKTAAGAPLTVGTTIDAFAVAITTLRPLTARVRRLRMVAGDSEAAVLADPATALKGDPIPFVPGVNPFRISGYVDTGVFTGFTGSPWTGAQTPDIWIDYSGRTDDIYFGYNPSNLPIWDKVNRRVTYSLPSTPSLPVEPLLALQILNFMRQAQEQFYADSAETEIGPMAFTFAQDRGENAVLGDPQPYTWIYENRTVDADPLWQLRSIESTARMARCATGLARAITFNGRPITYKTIPIIYLDINNKDDDLGRVDPNDWVIVVANAKPIVRDFLVWYAQQFRNLGVVTYKTSNVTFNGLPVTYTYSTVEGFRMGEPVSRLGDPSLGSFRHGPSAHAVAVFLRASLWMTQLNDDMRPSYDKYILGAWEYLERYWAENGSSALTWFRSLDDAKWYYSEFVHTLSLMLQYREYVPVGIEIALVEKRLAQAARWLDKTATVRDVPIPNMKYTYLGTSVLTDAPNEKLNVSVDFVRMTEDFDNDISIPMQSDYTTDVWSRPRYDWFVVGRDQHLDFRRMLYQLRGRATPFWYPTHSEDVVIVEDVAPDTATLRIENVGYTLSGGPRSTRKHLAIKLRSGIFLFREVVSSVEDGPNYELLNINAPFREPLLIEDVARISFMEKMRLDQDSIQIGHDNGTEGVSTSNTVFKTVIER